MSHSIEKVSVVTIRHANYCISRSILYVHVAQHFIGACRAAFCSCMSHSILSSVVARRGCEPGSFRLASKYANYSATAARRFN